MLHEILLPEGFLYLRNGQVLSHVFIHRSTTGTKRKQTLWMVYHLMVLFHKALVKIFCCCYQLNVLMLLLTVEKMDSNDNYYYNSRRFWFSSLLHPLLKQLLVLWKNALVYNNSLFAFLFINKQRSDRELLQSSFNHWMISIAKAKWPAKLESNSNMDLEIIPNYLQVSIKTSFFCKDRQ